MLNYDISRLKTKVIFGTVVTTENNITGSSVAKFKADFTVWCGYYEQSQTQQYTLLGTNQQDLITIVIRHNNDVKNELQAQLDGYEYSIKTVNSDDRIGAFDTVTLKKVSKVG